MALFRKIANYIKHPYGNPNLADRWSQFWLKRAIKKMSKRSMKNPIVLEEESKFKPNGLSKSYDEPYRHIDFEAFKELIN